MLELHSGGWGRLMFSLNDRKAMGETMLKPHKYVLIF